MRVASVPNPPSGSPRAPRAVLLGLAALLLVLNLTLPADSVATYGSVTTFADGNSAVTLQFTAPCNSTETLEFRLPNRANVTSVNLTVARNPDSASTRGVLRYDVGLDTSAEGSTTLTGNSTTPTNVSLPGGAFTAYLQRGNATPAWVLVPVGINSCSFPGGWNLTFAVIHINYTLGSPSGDHPPVFAGRFPDFDMLADSTLNTAIDYSAFFSDADVDPLEYTLALEGGSPVPSGWDHVRVRDINHVLEFTATDGWVGSVRLYIEARDPANQTARSNQVAINVLLPDRPPTLSGRIGDLNAASGETAMGVLDAGAYFSDPNRGPLAYTVTNPDSSPDWARVELSLRGSLLDIVRAGEANWTGGVCLALRATDENGSSADSNRFCIWFAPALPGPDPPKTYDVSIFIGHPYPDTRHVVLSAEPTGADGVVYDWYIDGEFVGRGESVSATLSEGVHVVRLVSSRSGVIVDEDEFTVEAGRAPAKPDPAGLPPSVYYGSLAAAAVFGLALSRLEVLRYFLFGALAAAVFARLKGESLLSHFTRGRLYQIVREHPGIRFNELKRRAEVGNGTAVHHLRVLHQGGYIRIVVEGTHTRIFPTDSPLVDDEYGLFDGDRDLLVTVQVAPGISVKDLAARIDRSPSATSRAVSRLAKLGYVRRERNGKKAAVFPRLKSSSAQGRAPLSRAADDA